MFISLSKVSGDFFTPGSQYGQWVLSYKVDGVTKTYCIADMANRDIGKWQTEPLAEDISNEILCPHGFTV